MQIDQLPPVETLIVALRDRTVGLEHDQLTLASLAFVGNLDRMVLNVLHEKFAHLVGTLFVRRDIKFERQFSAV